MRRIAERGHEVASHGWDHARVHTMDRAQFGEDIRKARIAIEDAPGVAVTGYRAPSFSIDQRTPWAYLELAEQGYAYSSSVAPVTHDHYGWREAPRFAFKPLPWVDLVEIPVTTAEFAGKRLAAGGGGFSRAALWLFALGDPAGEPARRAPGGVLFPPVGNRPGPAARCPAHRSSRGCGTTPSSIRWRTSSASWCASSAGGGWMCSPTARRCGPRIWRRECAVSSCRGDDPPRRSRASPTRRRGSKASSRNWAARCSIARRG